MADFTQKISQLPEIVYPNENFSLPIATNISASEAETYRTTLNEIRSVLLFENAYTTIADALAGTEKGDKFFVYTDTTKEFVSGWVNAGNSATALVDNTGTQLTWGTIYSIKKGGGPTVAQWIYNGGYAKGGETTITPTVPTGLSVVEVYINGDRQFKDQGFSVDNSNVITLAGELDKNDLVVVIMSSSDVTLEDLNTTLLATLSGSTGAAQIGVTGGGTVQDFITTLSGEGGASKINLSQGGTLQEAVSWVTLEMLGYDKETSSSADSAFNLWITNVANGGPTTLLLSPNTIYPLTESYIINFPHSIIGLAGANYLNTSQTTGSSGFLDNRTEGETDFLITVSNPASSTLVGWTWEGFAFWGGKRANPCVLFTAAGWAQALTRIAFWDIKHTALAMSATNDGTYVDIFFGNCGGITSDGTVRYALDMASYVDGLTDVSSTGYTNCSTFYRLHMEYCRYAMRIQGHSLHFHGAHIESGTITSYTPEFSPMINVYKLAGGVTFSQCNFSDAGMGTYFGGITDADSSNVSTYLANLPAMFGTTNTDTSTLNVSGQYYSYLTFSEVEYTTYNGYGRFVYLPNTQVNITNKTQLRQLVTFTAPVVVGPYSTIDGVNFYSKVMEITDTTSALYPFASKVNNVFGYAYQIASGWGSISNNKFFGFTTTDTTNTPAAGTVNIYAKSTFLNNILVNYSNVVSSFTGDHIFNALDISSSSDNTQRITLLPTGLINQGSNFVFQFPNNYTNSKIMITADSSSGVTLGPNNSTGKSSLGSSTSYWSNGYFGSSPTTVSDEKLKDDIQELSDTEIACAIACGKLYRRYKLKTAIAEKGEDGARYHIGTIAQYVVQCFTDHGLDWTKYGIITYESWEATEAVTDENGTLVTPAQSGGEIYMVRYDELNSFVNAGQAARLDKLEALMNYGS